MSEQFANNAQTTLAAPMGAADTSLTVASAAAFPTQGTFRILIDSELIIVGAASGTTFSSLTRGAENTSGATHNQNAAVTCILTKGALLQFQSDTLNSAPLTGSKAITNSQSPYAVLATDSLFYASAGASADTILLLPAATGSKKTYIVMRANDGSPHHVITRPHGTDAIFPNNSGSGGADFWLDIAGESAWIHDYQSGLWLQL
jgi:hypothetical protein